MWVNLFAHISLLSYYCGLSSAMNIFPAHQLTLPDEQQYSYSVVPYEMTNALGHTIAILQEYTITGINECNGFFYRLYKTKEGNWYEINSPTPSVENDILRKLKTAIDMQENSREE